MSKEQHIEDILARRDYPEIDVRSILRAIYQNSEEPFLSSGYEWGNKPHRLMKDCCCHISKLEGEIGVLKAELNHALIYLEEYRDSNYTKEIQDLVDDINRTLHIEK